MEPAYDLVLANGTVFDGRGSPARAQHVAIRGGLVAAVQDEPFLPGAARRTLDAAGAWVMPGFIDLHTHYDAEVELSPALSESVRHGVTTVVMGSCSLSLAVGTPEDLADMFCRVEAIPYDAVRTLLEERKRWDTHPEYLQHLSELPLGPNVASLVGHSAIRAKVLGIERSLDRRVRASADEVKQLERQLLDGLESGYLGLSVQTLPWDKVGGSRPIRSRPLPSTYATWAERRLLNRHLRSRGAVFQGVPNLTTKVNALLFLLESAGVFRRSLKTTLVSLGDPRAGRGIHRVIGALTRFVNGVLGGDFRWQALPMPFEIWADGVDNVVFEEFAAGAAALHLPDDRSRRKLLADPEYRARFKREWRSRFSPRVFHRNLAFATVVTAPDKTLEGKTFEAIARERGVDGVELFLDLVIQHGSALRWYTVIANDRPAQLEWILRHPDILVGFSDAGAHLRSMAFYNYGLHLLRMARDAQRQGRAFLTVERAVHRLTGEIAQWLCLDAGVLAPGRRADIAVIRPEGLDAKLDQAQLVPMDSFGGYERVVRRNDAAVQAVLIRGKLAWEDGAMRPEVGRQPAFGQVLRRVEGP